MSGHILARYSYDLHQTVNRDEKNTAELPIGVFLTGLHCLVRDPGTDMINSDQLRGCAYHGIKVEKIQVGGCREYGRTEQKIGNLIANDHQYLQISTGSRGRASSVVPTAQSLSFLLFSSSFFTLSVSRFRVLMLWPLSVSH